jgi:hypothetical protein
MVPLFLNMINNMPKNAMFVRGLVIHHAWMSFHYILLRNYRILRSGMLNS